MGTTTAPLFLKHMLLFCLVWLGVLGLFFLLCGHSVSAETLSLTVEERLWLNKHNGKVRLAPSPNWEPMEFFSEDGTYQGLIADYIRLLEKKLQFKFDIIRYSSWSKILKLAQDKEIDVIPAAQPTADRQKFMIWTRPYIHLKTTIIVNKTIKKDYTLDQMAGLRIGVPTDYAVGHFIRSSFPELTIDYVESNKEGLYKVSFGELDAMISEMPNALYVIENEKITNLRLAGDAGFDLHQGMGIRNDWPLFAGILDKALASISQEEQQKIHSRWIHLETRRFYHSKTFWYVVASIFACGVGLIGTVFVWNRTLARQVRQRTEAVRFNEMRLEAMLKLNERSNDSIQELIEFAFLQMVRLTKSRFGYLVFNDQNGCIYSVKSPPNSGAPHPTTKITKGFAIETHGLWDETVRHKKAIISNNYALSNPNKKNLPQKYSSLSRYITIPILNENEVVMVAGVGDKAVDYDASDLHQLTLLAQGLWRRLHRKQLEQAMAREQKNLRDIVEHSPNGITIIQKGKVVYRNSKQIELAGDIKLSETIGYDHIYNQDRKGVVDFYQSILNGVPIRTEMDFRFYSSRTYRTKEYLKWVTCLVTPIRFREEDAFLMTTIDRTRSRELEHLLTVQDKMASLGRVAAGIGHEIRNPLSGINIYLRTIERGLEDPARSHKIRPAIDAIRTASEKMEGVVKRVIDFARPTEPRFAVTDINIPVREAVELAGMILRKNRIRLSLDLDPDVPPCRAEPDLIEEVILNLINNAADAMAGQEQEKEIRIRSALENSHICVSVEDNGPGIPGDSADKIFEPFYTTKEYSTGIGLSLCQRIVTDHHGSIRAEQAKEGGARFTIRLPFEHKVHIPYSP